MVQAAFPASILVRSGSNLGFGRGCNLGVSRSHGDFVLFLNSDARLENASILRLVDRLRREPGIGAMGPKMRFEDGSLQPSAQRFTTPFKLALEELGVYKLMPRAVRAARLLGGYWDHESERDVDWLVAACLLVRRSVCDRTGGFDESLFLYGEDEEWCWRIRAAGWRVVFSPVAEVVHAGHVSGHRLLGAAGRVDRSLVASDRLLVRRHGRSGAALGAAVRVGGALLKGAIFSLRALVGDDDHGRAVRATSSAVLRHYLGRSASGAQSA
jgi:GT2 family glycosyltransferase